MAVMVNNDNLGEYVASCTNSPELSLLNFYPLTYHHSHFLAATFDFTTFSPFP